MMVSKNAVRILVCALLVSMAAVPVFANGSHESASSGASNGGAVTPTMTSGPDGYPVYNGGPATITLWSWETHLNVPIAAFEKLYPKIKIKWTNVGGGGNEYTKVLTATSAGKGLPDIVMIEYLFAPQFMDQGTFQAINKWVPRQLYEKYFPSVTLKSTSMQGKIYGTPQDSGAMTMVYRKSVFDKYGLKLAKTWSGFEAEAAKLHQQNPNIAMTTLPTNWVQWPIGVVWQAGGRLFDYANGKWYIDFTNPIAEKVFSYWDTMIQKKYARADVWYVPDWWKEVNTGETATVISGGWFPNVLYLSLKNSPDRWRVAELPQWDPAHPLDGEMGGSGFYVTSQSSNPEAAALFVLWLNSSVKGLTDLHVQSNLPILWGKNFIDKVAPPLMNKPYPYFGGQEITPVVLNGLKQVKTGFTPLPIMNYVQSSMATEMAPLVSGKESSKQFLENWQAKVVAFMKRQGFNNLVVGSLPK